MGQKRTNQPRRSDADNELLYKIFNSEGFIAKEHKSSKAIEAICTKEGYPWSSREKGNFHKLIKRKLCEWDTEQVVKGHRGRGEFHNYFFCLILPSISN